MSFLFDGTGDNLTGTFTSTYGDPFTLAVYVKFNAAHPGSTDNFLSIGNSSISNDQSYSIGTGATANQWLGIARTTTNGEASLLSIDIGTAWAGVVGVFTNTALRDVYVQTIAQTAQNTLTKSVTDAVQFIRAGELLDGARDFTGRLAELAVWNSALSTADITSYLAGTAASGIAAANLIGYWPLSADSLLNLGTDADGDLTATGNAVFDADHPTITSGIVIPVFMNQYRQRRI
jgi:hypothetical protein